MRNPRIAMSLLAALALSVTGCGGDSAAPSSDSGICAETDASDDLLTQVCEKGTITVSTDPAYPPQSSLDKDTGSYVGFDIDVATEIAKRLGVETAWEAPAWDVITAGNWNGRWEMSVGSMTPTNDRQKALHFSPPYYFTPAVVVVQEDDSEVQDLATDLDGKKVGTCSGCTYEQFLDKSLEIKGFTFDFIIDDAEIAGYDTDTTALQDLTNGRLDAVITSMTTAQGYIDAGNDVKIVGDPVFYEPLAVGIDRSSELDPTSLVDAVRTIVEEMHSDGTLTKLSKKWYDGLDLTQEQ